jgi:hypothetical protein
VRPAGSAGLSDLAGIRRFPDRDFGRLGLLPTLEATNVHSPRLALLPFRSRQFPPPADCRTDSGASPFCLVEGSNAMRAPRFFVFGVLAASFLLPVAVAAQDFHVETTLYALGGAQPKELMRSVTLFHAGKTYDFIPGMGELIVFDPAHGQFTLVNTRQKRMAEVHLDEINRMLGMARQALNDHLQVLQAESKPNQSAIEQILFQFNPTFEKSTVQTTAGPEIELKSKFFTYQVLGASAPTPTHAFVYLNYADWICRMNYILKPGGILPEQRLALDAALREASLVPVDVNFTIAGGNSPSIRATHHIYWTLNERDRELVRDWDGLLARNELKKVTFLDYQRSLLMSQTSRRR